MRTNDHRFPYLLICLALACLMCAWGAPARAADQQIRLRDFVLDNSDGQIAVRFGIGFTELDSLRLMLKEGARVTLTCEAALTEPGSLWFSNTLSTQELHSVLSYNVLTREYMITLSGQPTLHKSNSLVKLLAETWAELALNVGQLANLTRGEEYRVDLDIRMASDNVPPWLAKTLFFWSWDIAPSMHYSMDFTL